MQPEDFEIRSLCMFAPTNAWDKSIQSQEKIVNMLFMFQNNLWYNLLGLMKIHKNKKLPLKFDNIDDFLLYCSLQRDNIIGGFEERFKRVVKNTDFPISLVSGALDKTAPPIHIAKFNTILGLRNDQVIRIDPTIHTEKDIKMNTKRFNSYLIEDGKHFLHMKYHNIAKKILTNLLNKLEN